MADNTTRGNSPGGDAIRSDAVTQADGSTVKTQQVKVLIGGKHVDDGAVERHRPLVIVNRKLAATWGEMAFFLKLANRMRPRRMAAAAMPPMGVPSAPVFDPTQVSGLVAWYRADTGVTSSSGLVSQWNDQSGTGDANKNLAQATGTAQPTINATDATYGGAPSISTDGARFMFSNTWAASLAQPATYYWAGKIAANNGTLFGGDGSFPTPGAMQACASNLDGLSNNNWGIHSFNTSPNLSAAGQNASTAVVGCAVYNSTSSAIYISNSQTAAAGPGDAGAEGQFKIALFSVDTLGTNLAANGSSVAELLIYSGSHNAATRQNVMKYMGARYGLTAT